MRVAHRRFQGVLKSWESLFDEAARFASSVGPDRLISISHSEDANVGIVVVWYWSATPGRGGKSATSAGAEDVIDEEELGEAVRQAEARGLPT